MITHWRSSPYGCFCEADEVGCNFSGGSQEPTYRGSGKATNAFSDVTCSKCLAVAQGQIENKQKEIRKKKSFDIKWSRMTEAEKDSFVKAEIEKQRALELV